ncbi:MAG TPA: hypothetical protein VJ808_11495, partial [Gemmatimonadales bacterium]|nr:hypothetical protein [Gemmatimonadales bacterium]
MPRIPGPRTPGGPGPVIGAPRPREVSAARVTYGTVQPAPTMPALKSPLVDFGNTLSEIGLSVAEHIVQQERAAAQTKLQLSAVRQLGELENAVDAAGTASQARTIWDEQFPKIIGRLEKEANEVGLPEATGDLMLLGERSKISTRSAIAKRAAQEGADDAAALAAAYEERLAGARSEADFVGLRSELQRSLENTAQNNPLVSPGDADALLADTAQRGAVRRVGTLVDAAAANNDIAGLQGIQQQLSNLAAFTDLPADKRAALSASISDTIRQEEARRRAEAMRAGAIAASDLRIGIERADSPADLNAIIDRTEDLFGVGSLAPDTRASLVVAAERKKADLLEGQFELGNIMGRLALGFGLNSQKEADIAYAAEAQTVEPDQAAAHLVDFTTRAGIAPSQGTNLLARAERMEEPTQLATAAAYLRAVQDRSYAAASRMEVGERVASTMATAKVLGVPMEEAAQLIIDQGPDAAVRKSRREAFDAEFESWT